MEQSGTYRQGWEAGLLGCPMLAEGLDDGFIIAFQRQSERGFPVVGTGVDVRPVGYQHFDHVEIVAIDGQVKRREAVAAGKPLEAVKAIFESIEELSKSKGIRFIFNGVGTTGSGRKFIGKII